MNFVTIKKKSILIYMNEKKKIVERLEVRGESKQQRRVVDKFLVRKTKNGMLLYQICFGLITYLVLNLCLMIQNGLYTFKCFILVLNLYSMFQNGSNSLKRCILVLILLSLCKNVYMFQNFLSRFFHPTINSRDIFE